MRRSIIAHGMTAHATAPDVVCVLGMHRSGTSAVSRMLNLLGFELGPAGELIPPHATNPRGFWEHRGLVDVDEQILARLGGTWHEPPAFPHGWAASPALEDLRARARDLIDRDFTGVAAWSWKDPRACLTLPFWQQVLPPMRYVLPVRNPLDVARSLQARDGFTLDKGGDLWLRHVTASLRHTAGQKRLVVFYGDVVADPEATAASLARFVGRDDAWASEDVRRRVRESIEDELQHHRSTLREIADEPGLAFPAKALYLLLRMASARQGSEREGDPVGDAWLDQIAQVVGAAEGEPARLRWALADSEAAVLSLTEEAATAHARLADTEAAVHRLSEEAASVDARLAEASGEADALHARLSERETQLAALANTPGWRMLDRYRRLKEESAALAAVHAWTLAPLARWLSRDRRRT